MLTANTCLRVCEDFCRFFRFSLAKSIRFSFDLCLLAFFSEESEAVWAFAGFGTHFFFGKRLVYSFICVRGGDIGV
ncbi:hypothetical protein, partial [Planococcus sp. CAU13]|uniref:hypothetical protein n=1 Tax=Planococcus sp. CAU13 TaxID=1541197 RepID=UPI001F3B0444